MIRVTPSILPNTSFWHSAVKVFLLTGFIAGSLDILTAIVVYSFILDQVTPERLLQGIASGLLKKRAFAGGAETAIYGLIYHYLIAFFFTGVYFSVYRYISFLRDHPIVSGLLYGILIWLIMNLIVLPLVFTDHHAPTLGPALMGASILMVMIGLPVSLLIRKYFTTIQNNYTSRT